MLSEFKGIEEKLNSIEAMNDNEFVKTAEEIANELNAIAEEQIRLAKKAYTTIADKLLQSKLKMSMTAEEKKVHQAIVTLSKYTSK